MDRGSTTAIAYCGAAPAPADLWSRWNMDPWLLAVLLAALIVGIRTTGPRRPLFLAGWGLLVLTFVSPLCALSSALFSARVVHHVVLVAGAAPLLARAFPLRREATLAPPLLAATLTLWAWHVPAIYTAAIGQIALYWLMQLSLLGTALWFWASIFAARNTIPAAVAAIAAAMGQMGLVGALLTFAPRALYAPHLQTPLLYGLTPLEDQQLAGLIMWVPAMIPYFVFAFFAARQGVAPAYRHAPS